MASARDIADAYAIEDAERHKSTSSAGARVAHVHEGATFTFVDVSYGVVSPKTKVVKPILKGVTGAAQPGEVLALLGPSGSGKTSLLNVLAGRTPVGGVLSGEILVNGKPRDERFMREKTAYVMQEELLFPFLTVTETLKLHCKLRRGTLSEDEIERAVGALVAELGLSKVAHSVVGRSGGLPRGVSGGERKRVNIAVEMVSDPEALFLDEPTSGLDSFQALRCMAALNQLARAGRTIITTIHQPRSSIFAMFSQLLLISEGRLLYIGDAKDAVEYFASLSFDCPNLTNPADFYMDITSIDMRHESREKSSRARIEFFADEARARGLGKRCVERALEAIHGPQDIGVYDTKHAGWTTQFSLLFRRSLVNQRRDAVGVGVQVTIELVYALIVSALFRGVGTDQKGGQDRIGCLFFVVLNVAYTAALPAINLFASERGIVIRERASGAYCWSSYYLSKYVGELPKLLPRLLFCTLVYWIVGLRDSVASFWVFVAIIVAEAMSLMALGLLMASSMPIGAALALGPACITIFTLFGGIYLNIDSIPDGAKWIRFIDPIYYAYSALVANEFGGDNIMFTCDNDNSARCLESGQAVLELYAFQDVKVGIQIMAQMILQGGIHVIAFLALRRTSAQYMPLLCSTRASDENDGAAETKAKKEFQTV